MATKHLGPGAFKQVCLAILDDVAESKTEVIITLGRPMGAPGPLRLGKRP